MAAIHRNRTPTAGRRLLILLDDAAGELRLDALLPATTTDAAVRVTGRYRLTVVPGSRTAVRNRWVPRSPAHCRGERR
ncbi:hypothetical protein ABZT06_31770 [Streptomyces sp. NPDC005483]|uniref:hypothetical protein n=1 Tax=Streptomyces sp. NPDC005483 TaxID=3154882 RepID=UPI0033B9572F